MGEAFSDAGPADRLGDLSAETDRNIQAGFRLLFSGAMRGTEPPMPANCSRHSTRRRQLETLAFASVLMCRLDRRPGVICRLNMTTSTRKVLYARPDRRARRRYGGRGGGRRIDQNPPRYRPAATHPDGLQEVILRRRPNNPGAARRVWAVTRFQCLNPPKSPPKSEVPSAKSIVTKTPKPLVCRHFRGKTGHITHDSGR